MPAKSLRRCTICKKFHAAYLVEDPKLGTCYLCLSCWKARTSVINKSHEVQSTDSNKRERDAGQTTQEISIEA